MSQTNKFTVFTKSWPDMPIEELARYIKGLGFDGVELPVRPNYQVTPDNMAVELPKAAKIFADNGVSISSVAGSTDEATIAACGQAGVPVLRVMAPIDMKIGYLESEKKLRKQFDSLLPALEKSGVTLGVQNHCNNFVGSAIGLLRLIESYDPKLIGAVYDPAHCGLDGENDLMAIGIIWSHLCMLNLKSAYWGRSVGPEARDVKWQVHWTTGRQGIVSWPAVVAELRKRGYQGDVCICAEYDNPQGKGQLMGEAVGELAVEDLTFAKSLFA